MTLLGAWLVFPLVLGLLCLGCGLLLQRACGFDLPGPLLLPAGFVVLSLETQFAHLSDSTASLGTPLAVILALAGFVLARSRRRPAVDRWALAAGLGVFAVFAAPVVLSGSATFAGFMKLDDIANYLAMIDRGVHHGYNVSGLAPSTYETYLSIVYVFGYPLGSVLPLGVGSALLGVDAAWLWQPYLTFLAVLIGLGLYQLVSGVVGSRRLRALVAFVGAQAALMYGYALWGGVKEISTAFIVVLIASLVPVTVAQSRERAVLPLAAACAGLLCVLSVGGAAWLLPLLAGALFLSVRATNVTSALRKSAWFLLATGVLAIPAFAAAPALVRHSSAFTSSDELANLTGKLSWLQVFGIWPHGDFRTPPHDLGPTHVLIGVVAAAAVLGVWFAWRRRAWEVLLAAATVAFACAFYLSKASPWIAAKILASSSPVVLTLAIAAAAAVFETGRRVEAGALGGVIIAGVIWSNVLQYHGVYLAPRDRLADLAAIGSRFAGQGPTLMTEFEEYGSRHFLRNLTAEGAGELRHSVIALRAGGSAGVGESPDIDEITLRSVLSYRTLVLRKTGMASRPPSSYRLVYSGRYYQVWQRPQGPSTILAHLSLGSRLQPAAVPACSDVLRLARKAAAVHGRLATVERPPAIVIQPNGVVAAPTSFGHYGESSTVIHPTNAFTLSLPFTAPAAGSYGVWIGGSFRATLTASVDQVRVGSSRDQLAWPSTFTGLGTIPLAAGPHVLRIHYSGPDWRPGSIGIQFGLGPFALVEGTDDQPVTYVQPAAARSLCGKSLDWLEAVQR